MDFKDLQQSMVANLIDYGKRNKIKIDEDFAVLKLHEEVGELTQAVLIHKKKSRPEKYLPKKESIKKIANELADVVGMAIVNAHLMGIDLEKAMVDKWINKKKR